MAKRKKYPKLPNSFGSIRYLGKGRRNCYAVHPPATIDATGKAIRPPAICYVDDYLKGFAVLTAYKAGTYKPGMEKELEIAPTTDADALISRILSDYNTFKGTEEKHPETHKLTFSEVYEQFYAWKFPDGTKASYSSMESYKTAYSNCKTLRNRTFEDLKAPDLQDVIDKCALKKQSKAIILTLFKQMYKYAIYSEIVSENKALYVKVNANDDTEHGTPFSDEELQILWNNTDDPEVQLILIMCYSGWRIGEVLKLTTNLEERYFQGGIKTAAGKDRIVPIHPAIYEFVKNKVLTQNGRLCIYSQTQHRNALFYPTLERLGIVGDPKHTPHDCRHTFSALCEKYGVRENDRKRMLGHSFGNDVTNAVYGHRTLEELRAEIEKIKVPFVTNCD
ncbi:tyrosine-type recombinase/integrase [Blautia fusiformis]|jgi:integrase|uniref:Integrase n=1 Tax=Blautia fusiformis TaxID=2881264 RepID=A0AAW4WBS4_9FIRM|nr:integrase [Blautia fusiformis]MCC2228500.1 integrase [Blautia fusiformis]DAE53656.1 MAG TPA: Integrase [Caudoviricetes sp.]DAQ24044.1 MAG TPA: Integrase [Caudoviricetes sp.]